MKKHNPLISTILITSLLMTAAPTLALADDSDHDTSHDQISPAAIGWGNALVPDSVRRFGASRAEVCSKPLLK